MSRYCQKYFDLKKSNNSKMYLFKMGNFYIFLGEDAEIVSKYTTLKLTNLTNDLKKCGFPLIAYDKYLRIFENLNFNIEVIDDIDNKKDNDKYLKSYLKKLKKMDVNKVTPLKALEILNELVGVLNE